jgi:hypothetical protein
MVGTIAVTTERCLRHTRAAGVRESGGELERSLQSASWLNLRVNADIVAFV